MDESAKKEFAAKLRDVFTHIVKEETFVEASLVQDMRDPESILIYEVWNESPESFMKIQMSETYRAEYEKMIVDLKIDRTPAWYSTSQNGREINGLNNVRLEVFSSSFDQLSAQEVDAITRGPFARGLDVDYR